MKKLYYQIPILLCLFAICTCQIQQTRETVPAPASQNVTEKPPVPAVQPPAGDGLDSRRFQSLPQEARDYLKILAAAFRSRDKEFLISQGETQYEKDLRFQYDDETYLAMLYRIGPYSQDLEWKSSTPPKIDVLSIQAIEYGEWEEKGPMIDIKGRLHVRNSNPVPCGIMLIWRLNEPKILGGRP